MNLWKKPWRRAGALLTVAVSLLVATSVAGALTAPDPNEVITKVDICHRTNSNQNPYVINQPDASGDVNGHADHTGPVWNETLKQNHIKWGDIIPEFTWSGGHFDGLNWDDAGKAIYANDCVPTEPPEEQLFGQLEITKVVTGNDGVPANFTIHVDCDDKPRDDILVHPGPPVVFTDIEAGSTCIITEVGTGGFPPGTQVSFSPPTANTTGVLVDANQTVQVIVTNAFPTVSSGSAPPPVVVAPAFTG
jgi:hypothetical protein